MRFSIINLINLNEISTAGVNICLSNRYSTACTFAVSCRSCWGIYQNYVVTTSPLTCLVSLKEIESRDIILF
jgi:hypothetical protein